MGINGLKKIIKKYVPGALTEIPIETLKNTTIAIDSSILLYKFRYTYTTNNFHILGFLNIITELLNENILPVFIFDGKPPEAKQDILDKRMLIKTKNNERLEFLINSLGSDDNTIPLEEFINSDSEDSDKELGLTNLKESIKKEEIIKEILKIKKNTLNITRKHSLEVIDLLKYLGVPYFKAISEAEDYCAFLQKNNFVDYVLSEDTDSLTFGANKILFSSSKNNYLLANLKLILDGLGMDESSFIDFCILLGCDYTCKIPKIGPVGALEIIKKHKNIETFIKNNTKIKIPDNFNYLTARELFTRNKNYPKIDPIKKINFKEIINLINNYSPNNIYSFIN